MCGEEGEEKGPLWRHRDRREDRLIYGSSLWPEPKIYFNTLCWRQGLWISFPTEQGSSSRSIPWYCGELSDAEVPTLPGWQKLGRAPLGGGSGHWFQHGLAHPGWLKAKGCAVPCSAEAWARQSQTHTLTPLGLLSLICMEGRQALQSSSAVYTQVSKKHKWLHFYLCRYLTGQLRQSFGKHSLINLWQFTALPGKANGKTLHFDERHRRQHKITPSFTVASIRHPAENPP